MNRTVALFRVGMLLLPLALSHGDAGAQQREIAGGSVTLLLNHPLQFSRPDDRCEASICKELLSLIGRAEHTIDFAIYGARHQSAILGALLSAKARGVRVRGVVDRDADGANYYSSTDEWVRQLGTITSDQDRETLAESDGDSEPQCTRPSGFSGPLQCLAYDLGDSWLLAEHASQEDFTDPEVGGANRIMHHKFFVIDGRFVWTGSANISDSGTGGYNANAVLVFDAPNVAAVYSREFEALLGRRSPEANKPRDGVETLEIGDVNVTTWFSPQDDAMRFGVEGMIAKARRTVDVGIFYLTNKYVTAELIAAHQRGVAVRVIVDATSATNGYTKHELLRVAGIPVKVENWGGKMHMKAASIDNEFLVIGSMNWTRAGEDTNDENTVLLHSARMAAQFTEFFEHVWFGIPQEFADSRMRADPESQVSGSACSDGVDNDFDTLVDARDPGCSSTPPSLAPLPPHRVVPRRGIEPPPSHRLYESVGCDPSYPDWYVCIPPRPPSRDLDCGQVPYRRFTVRRPDAHNFDVDRNGLGCEAVPQPAAGRRGTF